MSHTGYFSGTHTPTRCPAGTWSNSTQLEAESDCTLCPAGWYCQQTGLTEPEAYCQQGYYCPEGKYIPHGLLSTEILLSYR